MGSVKDLLKNHQMYFPATPKQSGIGVWKVSGRFSVADLKEKIPAVEIPDKNYVLAMTAARYLEHSSEAAIDSWYIGMLDANGEIVDTQTLLDRGELSDLVVTELALTPEGKSPADLEAYHNVIESGDVTCYVADIETIFRAGVPLGSSVFKKIFELAGKGTEYESLAKYDELVKALPLVTPEINAYLETLGLDHIPLPGELLREPILNFTTKFGTRDLPISKEEAKTRMHTNQNEYERWQRIARRCAQDQVKWSLERNVINIDGKIEAMICRGRAKVTDFANTPDENRLMLRHKQNEISYLIPCNKEVQRALFRDRGIFVAVENAQQIHGEQWLQELDRYLDQKILIEATHDSMELMSKALNLVGNQLLGSTVFSAQPISNWVSDFLPYASREVEIKRDNNKEIV